jgi:hypothetical protein
MHTQSRYYIRTALIYLMAAFLVGGLVLINQGVPMHPRIGTLLPVFYHLLTVGWLTQLICGVALWMFPVESRTRSENSTRSGWVAYGALNGGLLLRVVFEPLHTWTNTWGWMLVLSAVLQVAAIWLFVLIIWPRVRGKARKKG